VATQVATPRFRSLFAAGVLYDTGRCAYDLDAARETLWNGGVGSHEPVPFDSRSTAGPSPTGLDLAEGQLGGVRQDESSLSAFRQLRLDDSRLEFGSAARPRFELYETRGLMLDAWRELPLEQSGKTWIVRGHDQLPLLPNMPAEICKAKRIDVIEQDEGHCVCPCRPSECEEVGERRDVRLRT